MTDLSEEELQEVYSWIDEIPLTRQKKNITRDFSDGVLTAEVVGHFLPKYVELHNYSPANAIQQKVENWRTLNSEFACAGTRTDTLIVILLYRESVFSTELCSARWPPARSCSRKAGCNRVHLIHPEIQGNTT